MLCPAESSLVDPQTSTRLYNLVWVDNFLHFTNKGVDLTEFWIVQEVEPQFFGSRGVHVRLVGD